MTISGPRAASKWHFSHWRNFASLYPAAFRQVLSQRRFYGRLPIRLFFSLSVPERVLLWSAWMATLCVDVLFKRRRSLTCWELKVIRGDSILSFFFHEYSHISSKWGSMVAFYYAPCRDKDELKSPLRSSGAMEKKSGGEAWNYFDDSS